MIADTSTIALVTFCLVNAAVYVFAEWRGWQTIRWLAKLAASTAFVVLALVNGAADSTYGRLILIALIFSWVGDALLLSLRSPLLLAGIAVFFFAHAAFGVAFASQRTDPTLLIIALSVLGATALLFLNWLWTYLETYYKVAVPFYLAAITVMTSFAIAASAASMQPLLGIGAMAFAASDVSVARNRFVSRNVVNKIWGVPLYYVAQLLFAVSVLSHS